MGCRPQWLIRLALEDRSLLDSKRRKDPTEGIWNSKVLVENPVELHEMSSAPFGLATHPEVPSLDSSDATLGAIVAQVEVARGSAKILVFRLRIPMLRVGSDDQPARLFEILSAVLCVTETYAMMSIGQFLHRRPARIRFLHDNGNEPVQVPKAQFRQPFPGRSVIAEHYAVYDLDLAPPFRLRL